MEIQGAHPTLSLSLLRAADSLAGTVMPSEQDRLLPKTPERDPWHSSVGALHSTACSVSRHSRFPHLTVCSGFSAVLSSTGSHLPVWKILVLGLTLTS